MINFGYFMGVTALALGVATGCVATVEDGDAGDETISTTSGAVSLLNTAGVWYAGNAPVTLSPISNSVCFLTEVHGLWRSNSYKAELSDDGTNWILSGTSGGATNGVGARCMSLPWGGAWTKAWAWNAGDAPNELRSASSYGCFLTEIHGKFDSANDTVRTRISGGKWFLDGTTDSGGGKARCVSGVSLVGSTQTVLNEGQVQEMAVNNNFSSPYACFLTMIGGNLMGLPLPFPPHYIGSAKAYVSHYSAGPAWPWALAIDSDGPAVATAGARCVN